MGWSLWHTTVCSSLRPSVWRIFICEPQSQALHMHHWWACQGQSALKTRGLLLSGPTMRQSFAVMLASGTFLWPWTNHRGHPCVKGYSFWAWKPNYEHPLVDVHSFGPVPGIKLRLSFKAMERNHMFVQYSIYVVFAGNIPTLCCFKLHL